MKKLGKKMGALALTGLLLLSLSACKGEDEEEMPPMVDTVAQGELLEKTELRLPYNKSASYDPLTTTDIYNFQLSTLVFDSLFTVDESMNFTPSLVETYTFDGLRLHFTLRGNVFFHDGSPLTTADVLYTLTAIRENGQGNFSKRLSRVSELLVHSESTMEIVLTEQNGLFPALLNMPIVKAVEPKEVPNFVGTGKYAFNEEFGKLIPNQFWFGEVKGEKEIPLINVPDEEAANFAYSTGEITVLTTPKIKSGAHVRSYVSNHLVFLGVNVSKVPLADSRLRMGLSAAISRTKVVDDNLQEGAFVALSPVHSKWFLYDVSQPVQGHNREEASKFFAEAGYNAKNETGVLVRTEGEGTRVVGKPLTLRLLVSKGSYDKKSLADTISNMLKEQGVEILVEEETYARYMERLRGGDFDLYLGEIKMTADMDLTPLVGQNGAMNYGRFSSPKVEEAMAALRKEPSKVAAGALINALNQEMPLIPLFYKMGAVAVGEEGPNGVSPHGQNPLNGL